LLKAADLGRRHESAGRGGFRSFVRFFSSMEEQEREEVESPTVDEGDDVVRMMTVHQAKGLESPIVVLADAGGRTRGGDGFYLDRKRSNYHFSLSFPGGTALTGSWGYESVAEAEARFGQEEMARLLYVATTRARDHLILPVVPPSGRYFGFLKLLREASAVEPGLRPGSERDASGPLMHCQIIDSNRLEIASPEERPFRVEAPEAEEPPVHPILLRARNEWKAELERILVEGARSQLVRTASGLEGELFDRTQRPGRRRLIGRVVHAVLESQPPTDPHPGAPLLKKAISAAALREGLDEREEKEALRLVSAAFNSSLPGRLRRARRFQTEFPLSATIKVGGREPVLLEGRIDLLVEEEDGCVVVDYKTDSEPERSSSDRFVEERMAYYQPQAAAYAAGLRAMGVRVKSALLIFLDANREVELAVDEAFVELGRLALTRPAPTG
jgi:ATP-dependent helicase/nuclease subunit A